MCLYFIYHLAGVLPPLYLRKKEFIIIKEVFDFIVSDIFKVIECEDNRDPYSPMI